MREYALASAADERAVSSMRRRGASCVCVGRMLCFVFVDGVMLREQC